MNKFTNGPWRILGKAETNDPSSWSVWGADGRFICQFARLTPHAVPAQRADAALIEAAPEMAELLGRLVDRNSSALDVGEQSAALSSLAYDARALLEKLNK